MCCECLNHLTFQSILSLPGTIGSFLTAAGNASIQAPGYLFGRSVTATNSCGSAMSSAWQIVSSKTNQAARYILTALLRFTGIDTEKMLERIDTLTKEAQALRDEKAAVEQTRNTLIVDKQKLTERVEALGTQLNQAQKKPAGWFANKQ
jgi:hypothetical protein